MARSPVSSRPLVRGLRGLARGAIAAGMLFAAATPGAAEPVYNDIYLTLSKTPTRLWVAFAFSDSDTPGYQPKGAMAYFVRPDRKEGEEFVVERDCIVAESGFPTGFPAERTEKPIYGPSSGVEAIDPITLPTFMANEVAKLMMEYEFASTEAEFAHEFNCAGYLWAEVLRRTPKEWSKILSEQWQRQQEAGEEESGQQ